MPSLPIILDVAIGMAFIFLVFSAIASLVNEWIARMTNGRGVYLAKGIIYLLCETEKDQARNALQRAWQWLAPPRARVLDPGLAKQIIDHPLIRRLNADTKNFPAYVPSSTFSLTMLDGLRGLEPLEQAKFYAQELDAVINLQSIPPGSAPQQPAPDPLQNMKAALQVKKQALDNARNSDEAQKAIQGAMETARLAATALADDKQRAALSAALDAIDVRVIHKQIDALPNAELKRALQTVLKGTESGAQKLDDVRKRVEQWFNDGMDRLSNLYKKRAQFFLVGVSVIVVALANADAIRILNTLWNDPTLRAALVAQAQGAAQSSALKATGVAPSTGDAGKDIQQSKANVDELLGKLQGVPLGWNCAEINSLLRSGVEPTVLAASEKAVSYDLCDLTVAQTADGKIAAARLSSALGDITHWNGAGLALKILGLILMAAGAGFGAPFWFDVINKLVPLRADKPKA